MWSKFKKDLFSVPNILSYFRLLLVPVFIWVYLVKQDYTLTAIILTISALTDITDGFIARKFNMITDWGKIIDPIADKATQFSILVCLMLKYPPVIFMTSILFFKEIYMGIIGYIVIKKTDTVTGAKWYGKLNTCVIYAIIMTLLLYSNISYTTVCLLVATGGICMIGSMLFYTFKYVNMLKPKQKK